MADSIYTFDPVAANNTALDTIPYGPNQLYHNQIDNWFRALAAKLAQHVDDIGGVNTVGGTANAITVTIASGITAYATGQMFWFKNTVGPNSTATFINVNTIGSKEIRLQGDTALSGGEMLDNGYYGLLYDEAYDGASGGFVLLNPEVSTSITFATNAQAVTGTSTVLSVNPNNLSAVRARRNRLVNPAMQISQENGNTSGTSTGYFVADQWGVYRVTSAGTITGQRVQSQTIYKSKDRARITITAADASLAAGEYLTLNQNIEGQEVADFAYGAAGARQSVLRFGFKGPAGTYAVSLKNSALNRSYVKTFSPAVANTDEMISIVIPGDTSGTWLTDTGIGISLDFVLAAGSTFQGTDAVWQSGNILGTSGVSNGMGTIAQVFEIFDVGLYLDPESTGVAPVWELPDYDDTLRQCQRYWEKSYNQTVAPGAVTDTGRVYMRVADSTLCPVSVPFKVSKRITASTVTIYNPTTGASASIRDVSSSANLTVSSVNDVSEASIPSLTLSSGPAINFNAVGFHWTANARM